MDSEEVFFRKATIDDSSVIVEFQLAMAMETEDLALDANTCTRGVDAVFQDSSLGRYYIAEIDDTVVGSLMITLEWSDWRAGYVWWIQSVFVRPGFRGRGVYGGLYGFVQDESKLDENVRGIRLYVDRSNETARSVYARLGMNGDHYVVFEWMKDF